MPIDVNRLLTTCERALSLDERANKYDPVDGLDCLTNALMAVKSDITTITYSQTFAVQTDEQNVFELPSQLIRLVSLTYPSTWKTTLQQVTRQFMDEAQAKNPPYNGWPQWYYLETFTDASPILTIGPCKRIKAGDLITYEYVSVDYEVVELGGIINVPDAAYMMLRYKLLQLLAEMPRYGNPQLAASSELQYEKAKQTFFARTGIPSNETMQSESRESYGETFI